MDCSPRNDDEQGVLCDVHSTTESSPKTKEEGRLGTLFFRFSEITVRVEVFWRWKQLKPHDELLVCLILGIMFKPLHLY